MLRGYEQEFWTRKCTESFSARAPQDEMSTFNTPVLCSWLLFEVHGSLFEAWLAIFDISSRNLGSLISEQIMVDYLLEKGLSLRKSAYLMPYIRALAEALTLQKIVGKMASCGVR